MNLNCAIHTPQNNHSLFLSPSLNRFVSSELGLHSAKARVLFSWVSYLRPLPPSVCGRPRWKVHQKYASIYRQVGRGLLHHHMPSNQILTPLSLVPEQRPLNAAHVPVLPHVSLHHGLLSHANLSVSCSLEICRLLPPLGGKDANCKSKGDGLA